MLSRKVWRAALRLVHVSPTLINAVRNQQVTPFLPTVGAFTTTTTLTSPVYFAVELLNTSTTLAAPVLDRWGYENYTHCRNALHSYNLQFADGFRTEESGNTVAGGAGEEGRGLVSVPLCGWVRSDPSHCKVHSLYVGSAKEAFRCRGPVSSPSLPSAVY